MPELNVQQKVIAFVQQNPQYEGKTAESVLSAMLALGEITQTEIDNLKSNNKNSTFGFGFETDYPLDFILEKPHSERGEISTTPTTQTQKKTVDFVQKRYEKAQANLDKQMLEDGWAGDTANFFKTNGKYMVSIAIPTVTKRERTPFLDSKNDIKKIKKALEIASLQAEQLKIAAEESSEAFKSKFKEIYGIEYNAQNIEAFERDEKAYLEALEAKNKEDAFNQYFEKLLNEDLADEFKTVGGGTSGATQTVRIPKEEIYEQEFKKLAELFGEGGEEFLNEYIKQAQAEDFAVDGFSAGTGTIEYKWNLLKKLAQGLSNRFENETKKACSGSDIEALEKRYENSYKAAFGNNNDIQKRVNDYNISQQKGAGIVKAAVPMAIMLAISIGTMGAGSAAALPIVAGTTATSSAGSILLSIAKSAVTIAGLSAGVEITDRFSSGAALKALREEGVLAYLETASELTDWPQIAKTSVSAGAMCVVFGGVSYAVSNLTRVAGTALKMSELGIAYASAATTSASTVATGLGVEYLMTGEISVEGTIFTVTMAVIGGVTQVMQIKKATPQIEQAREQLKTDGEIALKILDFQPGEEVTLESIKAHTAERAMKFVSASNSTPERQYMQLQFIQASHDLLTANIVEIQNLLKTGGINLAVPAQGSTYTYSSPSQVKPLAQIQGPQIGQSAQGLALASTVIPSSVQQFNTSLSAFPPTYAPVMPDLNLENIIKECFNEDVIVERDAIGGITSIKIGERIYDRVLDGDEVKFVNRKTFNGDDSAFIEDHIITIKDNDGFYMEEILTVFDFSTSEMIVTQNKQISKIVKGEEITFPISKYNSSSTLTNFGATVRYYLKDHINKPSYKPKTGIDGGHTMEFYQELKSIAESKKEAKKIGDLLPWKNPKIKEIKMQQIEVLNFQKNAIVITFGDETQLALVESNLSTDKLKIYSQYKNNKNGVWDGLSQKTAAPSEEINDVISYFEKFKSLEEFQLEHLSRGAFPKNLEGGISTSFYIKYKGIFYFCASNDGYQLNTMYPVHEDHLGTNEVVASDVPDLTDVINS